MSDPVLDMLLRDIVAHPDDDGPRLAYADRLEETGADDARAGLIRVQIELHRLRPGPEEHAKASNLLARHRKGAPVRMAARTPVTFLMREQLLLEAHLPRWRLYLDPDKRTFPDCRFNRGFVEGVVLTSREWEDYGPALVREAPLAGVALSDKWPSVCHRPALPPWYWIRTCGETGEISDRLSSAIFDLLPGGQDLGDGVRAYHNRAAAGRALSLALLAWAVAQSAPAPVH